MKVLITGAWKCTQEQIDKIKSFGNEVYFLQYENEKLPCDYRDVEIVIGNGLFLSHPIEKFTNLKYIQLTSAGVDRVPTDHVKAHKIEIKNAKGVYSIPMAEFAISGVLYLYKQIDFFGKNQKIHKWEKHRGILELYGKTVCIVGCGSVGTECAKRFSVFGCRVIGIDLFPYENPLYEGLYPLECLEAKLAESDIVILTLPLTGQTRHLMNADTLSHMKKNSILVNIARGEIVDSEALVVALRGKLGGAVLDVFEDEPLEGNSPLWEMKQVMLTPHNSFIGDGNSQRLAELIIKNMEQYCGCGP
ncbi:Glycerate dehydrogenase [uncultured Clostridium sp.]|uniref:D-2-hydroxyacid dehydrogenase n=1 Tax=Enterocloster citroniae TaxID=358743 RepID=UPI0008214FD3|nr:D-2-hydroxyacid dehydrogenase [Enterocloster citroniae]MCB7068188.1 D-2-hydroxyacid dehydrogenase [Enterocloster citroniae]SCH21822.1 Glycerate dehydrogenase [uncultured Clostridium sp.]